MPHHDWSDDWFKEHGNDLVSAIDFFEKWNNRLRGPVFFVKEKYGTMRLGFFRMPIELDAWLLRINRLAIHYWWLYVCTRKIATLTVKLRLHYLILGYQRLIFNLVTVMTVKKYIEVKDELLSESEFDGLLYGFVKKYLRYESHWVTYKGDAIYKTDNHKEEL